MAQLERAMDQVNLRARARPPARVHARPLRPLGAGGADPRARRLRVLDAPQPRARDRDARATRRRALARRIEVGAPERRARGGAAALRRAPRDDAVGDRSGDRARPGPRRRRRDRDRSRRLERLRDPRARAVPRVPVPARAPAADLRRPRARPDLAVLRLRLDARSGRRVPRLARCRRPARCAAGPVRPRPSRSSTCTGTSRATGALVATRLAAVVEALGGGARPPAVEIAPTSTASRLTAVQREWLLSQTLCYLRHLEVAGRISAEDGAAGERRWRLL